MSTAASSIALRKDGVFTALAQKYALMYRQKE